MYMMPGQKDQTKIGQKDFFNKTEVISRSLLGIKLRNIQCFD